ncbi:hypothetical protein [Alicyclobacillus ferrooxydans]|uniref:Uncharacterized protein n=1 Tax=Alicyclobacillus ferrooxydans TaxID=471514 RepID=A0A0N8PNV4_9BACL|nr:hypothetical protein [Alicyclobacillus ferrooxydans]KPV42573.1 hypothetical protein AN477_16895 [Alicyclobacillus ferrooxydans]
MQTEPLNPRIITLHWDQLISELENTPDQNREASAVVEAACDLLQRMQSENLPARYIFGLSDEIFHMASQLIDPSDEASAAVETAHFAIDDEAWDTVWHKCMNLTSLCDPSVAEVFI